VVFHRLFLIGTPEEAVLLVLQQKIELVEMVWERTAGIRKRIGLPRLSGAARRKMWGFEDAT